MYYYIYDQFLSSKKYDKILAQIESKITDLGIKDRILKISILKSIPELVRDALRKGASTIVVVGNDSIVNSIINLIAGRDVLLGIVPIDGPASTHGGELKRGGGKNFIANFLGIKNPLEACEIISARKIETLNLGEINNNYFISSVKVFDSYLKVTCDKRYSITPLDSDHFVSIYNFLANLDLEDINFTASKKFFNPQDNFLEVVVEPKDKKALKNLFKSVKKGKKPDSIIRVKKAHISSLSEKPGSVIVDNFKVFKTPLDIKISDKKLDVIVGKDRKF